MMSGNYEEGETDFKYNQGGEDDIGGNDFNKEIINNEEYVKSFKSAAKLYGLSFQNNKSKVRIAASSIETSEDNLIEIIDFDANSESLRKVASHPTEFPCSKIQWSPNPNNNSLFASTSDMLRLYKFDESYNQITYASCLNKPHEGTQTGPLTSMAWNKVNPAIIGVCSIDTTCTIWDLVKSEVKTILIAHDKEVFDIAFGTDENIFLSTGADGSVRMFDTRALDTCNVLFESQDGEPITRIAWNFNNTNFIAALLLDKNFIYILDQRMPNSPYACLSYHSNVVNAVSWAPNSNAYICSVGDDKNALLWDIQLISNKTEDPLMCYSANNEIENISWSESHDDWIGITSSNELQILKIK